jgi:ATP-dependent Clp protease ATP-binding subunit ClpA
MTKKHFLNPSSILAWRLANYEAQRNLSEQILPIHLLLAILIILDEAYSFSEDDHQKYDAGILEARSLNESGRKYLDSTQLDVTVFRRRIQKKTRSQDIIPGDNLLDRSPDTRNIFNRAILRKSESVQEGITFLDLLYEIDIRDINSKIITHDSPSLNNKEEIEPGAIKPEVVQQQPFQRQEFIERDLTELASGGKLPTIVGRDNEIKSIAKVMVRTSKRNVIIVGEAGVGKTALIEGLAQWLPKKAPPNLKSLHIIQLNIADIVSNTQYRGQLESRVQGILNAVEKDPNLVIFIDEIHLLIKAGAAEGGALDIANIMKPILAGDNIRCIGATTTGEYDRYIKQDLAFSRRFQVIMLSEPSPEFTKDICTSWVKRIERQQGVKFTSESLEEAIKLTNIYVKNRAFPDKAIDLLENTAANKLIDGTDSTDQIITVNDIRSAFSDVYQINLDALSNQDSTKLLLDLQKDIIGQDDAIKEIADQLQFLFSAKDDFSTRPLGVLLFVGPPGVGKAYTAKKLEHLLYPENEMAFISFHMSDYREKFDLSRLIGSSPGLIGSDNQGALFHYLIRASQGIILLEEIDKAHCEIQEFFLQIFKEGEARDNKGKTESFNNHLFILTVDIKAGEKQIDKLDLAFSRDFLAQIDDIIQFKKLDPSDYERIFDQKLDILKIKLSDMGNHQIIIDEISKLNIVIALMTVDGGVQGFIKRFEKQIALPLSQKLKQGGPSQITISWLQDEIVFS